MGRKEREGRRERTDVRQRILEAEGEDAEDNGKSLDGGHLWCLLNDVCVLVASDFQTRPPAPPLQSHTTEIEWSNISDDDEKI